MMVEVGVEREVHLKMALGAEGVEKGHLIVGEAEAEVHWTEVKVGEEAHSIVVKEVVVGVLSLSKEVGEQDDLRQGVMEELVI